MNDSMIKTLTPILVTLSLCILSACKTSDSISNNDTQISYINALDEQASFYAKKDSNSSNVYDDENYVVSLLKNEVSEAVKHRWFSLERTSFSVEDTNSRSIRTRIKSTLKDKNNYWLVAWLKENNYQLSLLKKVRSNRDNIYRVRLFTTDRFKVYIDDSENHHIVTSRGEVSPFITVSDCSGLQVGDNHIDLCSVDPGSSYLVIVNEDGLIAVAKE